MVGAERRKNLILFLSADRAGALLQPGFRAGLRGDRRPVAPLVAALDDLILLSAAALAFADSFAVFFAGRFCRYGPFGPFVRVRFGIRRTAGKPGRADDQRQQQCNYFL